MPPTRREQLELDELLSDIYRGIESLPDKSHQQQVNNNHYTHTTPPTSNKSSAANHHLYARTYVKEYELPASSPIVKEYKQELRNEYAHNNTNSPKRSTLKRYTPDQSSSTRQQQPKSLASLVTSTTPENKRRVRIVDHPDKIAKGYTSDELANDYHDDQYHDQSQKYNYRNNETGPLSERRPHPGNTNVKYVNTNKLIYHQERNPDDNELDEEEFNEQGVNNNSDENNSQEDDVDGVTRVEYYHTTWLDRQLGRASKRRSSKELNERQVKEKAMIEELKRSLKNGAITLRQSFRGKRNSKSKPSATFDDQMLDSGDRVKESSVFGSGLATLPRKHHSHHQNNNNNNNNQQNSGYKSSTLREPSKKYQEQPGVYGYRESPAVSTPKQTSDYSANNKLNSSYLASTVRQPEQKQQSFYHSRTLPHNYQQQQPRQEKKADHQLLQSHYKGNVKNFNTLDGSISSRQQQNLNNNNNNNSIKLASNISEATANNMRNPGAYNNNNDNCSRPNINYNPPSAGYKSPTNVNNKSNQTDHQTTLGNTISSIPSATEVVRSALSRSSSQVSLNQLNKTINLLPNSPSPFASSPTTPTKHLKAATPSFTPSPSPYQQRQHSDLNTSCNQPNAHYNTARTQPGRQQPGPGVLSGTRAIGRMPEQQPQQQPYHQQQQPVYANPHASLMQHRMEQQMKQPGRNAASIREFNELDSLLRSLSPGTAGAHTTAHVTPGFTARPAQPAFGLGVRQPQQQHQQQPQAQYQGPKVTSSDIYAQVQKQPTSGYQQQQHQQQHQQQPGNIMNTHQPYTIDVTNKKDENCLQRQELSEFEPPIELLPSMEDYQNITKLNPVKNHYWYKPNMSRERAINLLRDKPQGTFIVRDSTSFKGAYGLAVKVAKLPKNVLNNANLRNPNADPSSELIRHFLIEPSANGVRLKGYANEAVYDSLPDLIYQHSLTEIALPCKLVIPRTDIEDPAFNYKQKQFYDDFVASKELAKHQPYGRTSPNGGYRKYPGDVYVHNEHRIIFE